MTMLTPGVWTYIENTGVQVRYDGTENKEVTVDEHGAVILPAFTSEDETEMRWSMVPGNVPVFRADQMPDLADEEQWPAGFILSDGMWMKTGS